MNYKALAQKHLQDALDKGYITLEDGVTRELKSSEILAVAKYVLKEGLEQENRVVEQPLFPSEILKLMENDDEL